jgi:nucleolar protein 15
VDDNIGKAVPDTSSRTTLGTKKQRAGKPTKPDHLNDHRSNVIYVGHLPALFGERELVKFLKQFGGVTHVRVSRSVKTGGSKGYAFCRLEDADVAAIVADTLSGYLMFDAKLHIRKRLVCHVVPSDKVHPRLFISSKSAASVKEARRQKVHAKPPIQAMDSITTKLVERERKKRAQLKEMGIDYTDFPGYEAGLQKSKAMTELTPAKSKEPVRESNPSLSSQKKRKESIESVATEPSGSAKKRKNERNDSVQSAASTKSKDGSKETPEHANNPQSKSSKKYRQYVESSSESTFVTPAALKSSKEKHNNVVGGHGDNPATPVSANLDSNKKMPASSSTKKSKVRSESIEKPPVSLSTGSNKKMKPNATITETAKHKESIDKAATKDMSVSKLSAPYKPIKSTKDKAATVPSAKKTASSPTSAKGKERGATQSEKKAKRKHKDKNRRSV